MNSLRLQMQAWGDFWSRHLLILKAAWSRRHEHPANAHTREEAEFLADALAVMESPPSPAPRVTAWLLLAFTLIALGWACLGKNDIVVVAQGKAVLNGRSKNIQSFDTAVVKAIHVRDGDTVRAGDLLIEFDAASTQAEVDRASKEWHAAALQNARFETLLGMRKQASGSGLPTAERVTADDLLTAGHQAGATAAEHQAKLARADAEVQRKIQELASVEVSASRSRNLLPLAREQEADYQALLQLGQVSRHAFLDKQQRRLELEAELAAQLSRATELKQSLLESQAQRQLLAAEARRTWLDALNEARQKMSVLTEEGHKARFRSAQMQLRAPADGVVQQLAMHTLGGVVTPAQVLMVLVPRQDGLMVEAMVENKDVGYLSAGQAVELKFEAFPYTKFGTLPGKVLSVSRDAVNDEKRGLLFVVQVELQRAEFMVEAQSFAIHPGMASSVEIKTGQRPLIEYFLSPLLEYKHESLRER